MTGFEYVAIFEYNGTVYRVGVDKVGGGTVGKEYSNEEWEVTVLRDTTSVFIAERLYVGGSANHATAALEALSWSIDEGGECVEPEWAERIEERVFTED